MIQERSTSGFHRGEVFVFMTDLMSAVMHLQTLGVTHGDIKPVNILCQDVSGHSRKCLKLADFGLLCFALRHVRVYQEL